MKKEKQYLLDEVKGQLVQSGSYIIAQYAALDANKANAFRRELAKVGGKFEVVKKRVFLKAAQEAGATFPEDVLSGHIGIVLSYSDPFELTKSVIKYSDSNDKVITLLGGYIEGREVNGADIARIATLPSKAEMQAQLLGLFEAPMSGMLSVVEALLTSVMHCMENRCQKSE